MSSYLIPWNGTFSHGEDCHRSPWEVFRLYRFDLALIETEIFGKLVVENSGGHYCKVKEAMSLVSEVMTVLMFEQFKADQDSTSCELDQQIETTETKLQHALDVDRT